MSRVEEKAFDIIQSIFQTLSHENDTIVDQYFACDMLKDHNKDYYPCFIGYNHTTICIVQLNAQLEQKKVQYIDCSNLKSVHVKKRLFSKFCTIKIQCVDHTFYKAGVPFKLDYLPVQERNLEGFIESFQN